MEAPASCCLLLPEDSSQAAVSQRPCQRLAHRDVHVHRHPHAWSTSAQVLSQVGSLLGQEMDVAREGREGYLGVIAPLQRQHGRREERWDMKKPFCFSQLDLYFVAQGMQTPQHCWKAIASSRIAEYSKWIPNSSKSACVSKGQRLKCWE